MSKENRELHEQWKERIATQRASGLTQREWSKREGISKNTFSWWVKQLGLSSQPEPTKKGSDTFVQVVPFEEPAQMPGTNADSGIELSIIRIRLSEGYGCSGLCEIIGRVMS